MQFSITLLSPFGKRRAIYLKKKSVSPLPKYALFQVWLKGLVVLEKIFKFSQCISAIPLLSLFGKSRDRSFKQT